MSITSDQVTKPVREKHPSNSSGNDSIQRAHEPLGSPSLRTFRISFSENL
jgi:hypothetical protein